MMSVCLDPSGGNVDSEYKGHSSIKVYVIDELLPVDLVEVPLHDKRVFG